MIHCMVLGGDAKRRQRTRHIMIIRDTLETMQSIIFTSFSLDVSFTFSQSFDFDSRSESADIESIRSAFRDRWIMSRRRKKWSFSYVRLNERRFSKWKIVLINNLNSWIDELSKLTMPSTSERSEFGIFEQNKTEKVKSHEVLKCALCSTINYEMISDSFSLTQTIWQCRNTITLSNWTSNLWRVVLWSMCEWHSINQNSKRTEHRRQEISFQIKKNDTCLWQIKRNENWEDQTKLNKRKSNERFQFILFSSLSKFICSSLLASSTPADLCSFGDFIVFDRVTLHHSTDDFVFFFYLSCAFEITISYLFIFSLATSHCDAP